MKCILKTSEFIVLEKYFHNDQLSKQGLWKLIENKPPKYYSSPIVINNANDKLRDDNFIELHWSDENNYHNNEYRISELGRKVYNEEFNRRKSLERKRNLEDKLLSASFTSNKWSPIWAGLAAFFAFGSILVSVITFINAEKIRPELEQINKNLQSLERKIESTQSSLERASNSIQTLKSDTTVVRVVKN